MNSRNPFVLVLVNVLVTLGTAQAQLQPLWTRIHGPPNSGTFAALARDAGNNVCALVDRFGDFATIKYSPDGTALWTNRYNSPLYDRAGALALDSSGTAWVVGVSSTDQQRGDLVLLKYAPDGSLLWTRSGDATGVTASASSALAIATDSAGNAFVAATSTSGWVVIKFGSGGAPLWTTLHPIETNSFTSLIKRVAIDASGVLTIVGEARSASASSLTLLKYANSGALLLRSVQPWPESQDFLTDAAVDSEGNIYVAASVRRAVPWLRYHLFTAKYDTGGVLKWSRFRAPVEGYHAVSHNIALDAGGNVIVTGHETHPVSQDEDQIQTLTLKYDAAGAELWSARSGFDRTPRGLVVDAGGVLHVAADDRLSTGFAGVLLKYLPNGNQVGERQLLGRYVQQMAGGTSGQLYLNVGGDAGPETQAFQDVPHPLQPGVAVTPQSITAPVGTDVTLTAAVSGAGPFQYQWFRLGYYLTGQTNATLALTNLSVWGMSPYTVRVTNAVGYAISPEAHVAVVPSIAVTRLPDRIRLEWEPSTTFRLESTDSLLGGNWKPVPLDPSVNWHEVNPGSQNVFFRLAR